MRLMSRTDDRHRRREALRVDRRLLDRLHDVHAAEHAPECGEPLAVEVAAPAEVERRLRADGDEEVRRGRVGPAAGHGKRARVESSRAPPWITSILTESRGWLSIRTAR